MYYHIYFLLIFVISIHGFQCPTCEDSSCLSPVDNSVCINGRWKFEGHLKEIKQVNCSLVTGSLVLNQNSLFKINLCGSVIAKSIDFAGKLEIDCQFGSITESSLLMSYSAHTGNFESVALVNTMDQLIAEAVYSDTNLTINFLKLNTNKRYSQQSCPTSKPGTVCSGRGDCNKEVCECYENFDGPSCSICALGRTGDNCEYRCPLSSNQRPCNGVGDCRMENGAFFCYCPYTHFGPVCEVTCINVECNSAGGSCVVVDANTTEPISKCLCKEGFFGEKCDKECPRSLNKEICSNHGRCLYDSGKCLCDRGFSGPTCEITEGTPDPSTVYILVGITAGAIIISAVILSVVIIIKKKQESIYHSEIPIEDPNESMSDDQFY